MLSEFYLHVCATDWLIRIRRFENRILNACPRILSCISEFVNMSLLIRETMLTCSPTWSRIREFVYEFGERISIPLQNYKGHVPIRTRCLRIRTKTDEYGSPPPHEFVKKLRIREFSSRNQEKNSLICYIFKQIRTNRAH